MNTTTGPGSRLVEIPTFDCWHLLESAEIGRVAWNGPHGVAVVPVNYAIADGALWFRTSPYSQLARECGGQWVAVEIDSVDRATRSGWSAVIRGTAEVIDADEAPQHLAEFQVWPSGVRHLFIRVEPLEMSGRRLLPPPADG
jgi:nitroimidazol reductase NimA-like FMN-containing flavoprotein (pyridoxamine 5'-phosphate oxidase superfamily)